MNIFPEYIEFDTSDGLSLPGLFYESKNSKKAAIFLHGNGSTDIFYDGKNHTDLPLKLNKKGVSLLKFNNRGAHIIKKLDVKKGIDVERKKFGCAYEIIKECVYDIDGALNFLKKRGYAEFYLIGTSTGANKIAVYNHYKPLNEIKKYILIAGGDDTGIYYNMLGKARFTKLLNEAVKKIGRGNGEELIKDIIDFETISYKGFFDLANPDGDYNCFPFLEAIKKIKLSKKPLFRFFGEINKPSLVIYGELDEYAWGDVKKVVEILKAIKPEFDYKIVGNANHGFEGKKEVLATIIANWL